MSFGGLGRSRRKRHLNAEVNIINLVDVVLVLLIIFMLAAPMMETGITVKLPKAVAASLNETPTDLVIAIDQNGKVLVGKATTDAMTIAAFVARMPALIAQMKSKRLIVRADGRTTLNQLAPIHSATMKNGIDYAQVYLSGNSP